MIHIRNNRYTPKLLYVMVEPSEGKCCGEHAPEQGSDNLVDAYDHNGDFLCQVSAGKAGQKGAKDGKGKGKTDKSQIEC